LAQLFDTVGKYIRRFRHLILQMALIISQSFFREVRVVLTSIVDQ
jgi:hypothetical protein